MKNIHFLKEKTAYLWGVLFLLTLVIFSLGSGIRLMRFYINHQTNYNEWTEESGTPFETDHITNFFGKNEFINIHGGIRKVLGREK